VLVDGKLVLTNVPVADSLPVRLSGILRDINRWFVTHSNGYQNFHDGLLGLIRNGDSDFQQRQQNARHSADKKFMKEMHGLGEALVDAMHQDSLEHDAVFVLITPMRRLHTATSRKGIFSLDVSRSLSNPAFALPGLLEHLNESGNGVLTWDIAECLQTNQLIPAQHSMDR